MADNYLERKMDDLRNGRLQKTSSRFFSGPKKGFIRFPLPTRRVLVIGGATEPYISIARAFRNSECKVAILDKHPDIGGNMARNEGMRFIEGEPNLEDSLREAFDNLTSAWRDIDIIVANPEQSLVLSRYWISHKKRFPIPSEYGGRMIILTPDEEVIPALNEELGKWKITVNTIVFHKPVDCDAVASLALFLASSVSGNISGSNLIVKSSI